MKKWLILPTLLASLFIVACGKKENNEPIKKAMRAGTQRSSSFYTQAGSATAATIGISVQFDKNSTKNRSQAQVSFNVQVNGSTQALTTVSPYGQESFDYYIIGGLHTYVSASCLDIDCGYYVLSIMSYNEDGTEGKQLAILAETGIRSEKLIQQVYEASTSTPGSMLNIYDLVEVFYPMP